VPVNQWHKQKKSLCVPVNQSHKQKKSLCVPVNQWHKQKKSLKYHLYQHKINCNTINLVSTAVDYIVFYHWKVNCNGYLINVINLSQKFGRYCKWEIMLQKGCHYTYI